MRPLYVATLCLLASGACKKKGPLEAVSVPDPGSAAPSRNAAAVPATAPVPTAAPVPAAADAVLHRAFSHASDTFAVSDVVLEYVRQDGTLDPTYGHAQFKFGHRPHPPPPPADDPKRPIGAPIPPSPPAVSLFERSEDCPRVTWESGQLDDEAGGISCEQFMPPIRMPLSHPRCTVREIWKRAIAKGAPAEALARLQAEGDMLSDDARQVWKFAIEDAPRGIHIEETFADDCNPVVEQPQPPPPPPH